MKTEIRNRWLIYRVGRKCRPILIQFTLLHLYLSEPVL